MTEQDLTPVLLPFGKTIYQTSRGQAISTDTSNLVQTILKKEKNIPKKVLEFGTGNGIISLMLAHYNSNWEITAFDIQEKLIDLAKKNAKIISQKITFLVDDIKNPQNIPDNNYDLIFGNPPYFKKENTRISPIYERAISRNEILCEMSDVLNLVKQKLARNGKSYLIYPESRLKEFEEKTVSFEFKIFEINFFGNHKKSFFIAELKNA